LEEDLALEGPPAQLITGIGRSTWRSLPVTTVRNEPMMTKATVGACFALRIQVWFWGVHRSDGRISDTSFVALYAPTRLVSSANGLTSQVCKLASKDMRSKHGENGKNTSAACNKNESFLKIRSSELNNSLRPGSSIPWNSSKVNMAASEVEDWMPMWKCTQHWLTSWTKLVSRSPGCVLLPTSQFLSTRMSVWQPGEQRFSGQTTCLIEIRY
jgi:hypothetical protein